jgi:ABC-type uncharacterized transport system fused permease/ATPase subunit
MVSQRQRERATSSDITKLTGFQSSMQARLISPQSLLIFFVILLVSIGIAIVLDAAGVTDGIIAAELIILNLIGFVHLVCPAQGRSMGEGGRPA